MSDTAFSMAIDGVAHTLEVVQLSGREAISKLFRFDVTVRVDGCDPSAFIEAAKSAGAVLRIHGAGQPARSIGGVVAKVRSLAMNPQEDTSWFLVRLRPEVWRLKKRVDNRVFQDATTAEIVTEVLDDAGIKHALRLEGRAEKRRYCVQYQESDFAFIERLLAEDGIFYFLEDPGVVVMSDAARLYQPIQGESRLPYRPEAGSVHGEGLKKLDPEGATTSTSVLVKHFDYARPQVRFEAAARTATSSGDAEVFDYRFELEEDQAPPQLARTALEQAMRGARAATGTSHCRRLAPGRTFELTEHPAHALDGNYVVASVTHTGRQAQRSAMVAAGAEESTAYENTFACLPADVPASPRAPKRRLQQVVETAFVTGPDGEEIHVDAMGRVKVQFHWDRRGKRDDRTSTWLRVIQPWAGTSWGTLFLPRVGMEVLVGFVGGDTDRPVVLGSLYNGATPVPFPLPDSKTQSGIVTSSTPGGQGSNVLRFDDAAGREQIYVHAQQDLDEVVERNQNVRIGGDLVREVSGNQVESIGGSHVTHISGRQLMQVSGQAPKDNAGARPPAAPHRIEPVISPQDAALVVLQQVKDAALLLEVARLPPDLASSGRALEGMYQTRAREVARLRKKVSLQRGVAQVLLERAALPAIPHLDHSAIVALENEHKAISSDVAALTKRMADESENIPNSPALAPVKRALAGALEQLAAEATHHERSLGLDLARLCRARDGLRIEDAAAGGGGVPPTWTEHPVPLIGPPGPYGIRPVELATGGYVLDVEGGGLINSKDGLTLSSAGCMISLHNGAITLNAAHISLLAGKISISGGEVDIHGAPIKLNC